MAQTGDVGTETRRAKEDGPEWRQQAGRIFLRGKQRAKRGCDQRHGRHGQTHQRQRAKRAAQASGRHARGRQPHQRPAQPPAQGGDQAQAQQHRGIEPAGCCAQGSLDLTPQRGQPRRVLRQILTHLGPEVRPEDGGGSLAQPGLKLLPPATGDFGRGLFHLNGQQPRQLDLRIELGSAFLQLRALRRDLGRFLRAGCKRAQLPQPRLNTLQRRRQRHGRGVAFRASRLRTRPQPGKLAVAGRGVDGFLNRRHMAARRVQRLPGGCFFRRLRLDGKRRRQQYQKADQGRQPP